MKRVSLLAVATIAIVGLSAGIISWQVGKHASQEITLSVFCAAGLRPPVADVIELFEQETGVKVECTYGAANLLLGQLKIAQRGDVFVPGDRFYAEKAQAENLVDGIRTVAYFIPVIMVKKGNPLGIHSLGDLTKDGVRVGLADERAAAVGRIARQVLEKSGVDYEAVQSNVRFTSTTVNELGDAVKLGHLDAVIIWNAVAHQFADVGEIVPIPAKHNVVVSVPAAVISASQNRESAEMFIDYLTSQRGREVFRKHHYDITDPSEENR